MSVTIPDSHPDLNLAAWLDRRRDQIGPWSDYIITEVGKLEREIAHLRTGAEQCCMCGKTGLSTAEDGGPECELHDGRWVCSSRCYEQSLGWQDIRSSPVGIPVLAYCYGGDVLMTRITKNGEDEYARMPDLWMPIPKPPTKYSTHD